MKKVWFAGSMVAALLVVAGCGGQVEQSSDGDLGTSNQLLVTFDPSTGTGFVGKGDVQSSFGWNNAGLQANAAGVTFFYDSRASYTAVCTFTTGDGTPGQKTHNVDHHKKIGALSDIEYSARVHHQIDGFILEGFEGAGQESGGTIPVEGDPCPGNPGHDGIWTSVTADTSGTGLYVSWNGTDVLIWTAP